MKLKIVLAAALSALFGVYAETINIGEDTVTYFGASEVKTLPDGDVVLVYTNALDHEGCTFTLPKNAKVRMLAVGGGGAGGSMAAVDEVGNGSAGGGGAGGVSDVELILRPGEYTVRVGAGGRRVQTIVQSWVGANGENTMAYLGEQQFAIAKGGGGGGSVKTNGRGESGGSGGGGSWYGVPTKNGTAVDGQGWQGGVVDTTGLTLFGGAGGGGAALAFEEGRGKADGTPGEGRVIDITGEDVVYGRGGRGGSRTAPFEAQDGAGYGSGGDGASVTGRGGAGADGIFIVRIHKLFEYGRVDVPPPFEAPVWTNNSEYVAFDLDAMSEDFKNAVDYIEGVTATNTSLTTMADGTVVTNGLGRFHYAIHLKDEYVWNDGSATGSTRPLLVYWRVKDPGTVGEARIDVTKTVAWSEGNNAEIDIKIIAHPETVKADPRVLMLGSLCSAHGFDTDVVNSALNAVAQVGDIDYFFYNPLSSTYTSTTDPSLSGSLAKGQTANLTVSTATTQHGVLYAIYHKLSQVINEGIEYDYIIFTIDRGLVATRFHQAHPDESRVVDYMRKLYARNAVIWLVDNEPRGRQTQPSGVSSSDWKGNTLPDELHPYQTPWHPGPVVFAGSKNMTHAGGGNDYYGWTLLDAYVSSSSSNAGSPVQQNPPYGWVAYHAMMGIFDPDMYDSVTQEDYGATIDYYQVTTAAQIQRVKDLTGRAIENQVVYDDAHAVGDLISQVVKERHATIEMKDAIFSKEGLTIRGQATGGYWTTNQAAIADGASPSDRPSAWTRLTSNDLTMTDSNVHLKLDGIRDTAEIHLTVAVTDTGSFRTSVGAKLNQMTGLWEKDPNDGPVHTSIRPENSETVWDEAVAATAVAWSFPTYNVRCQIVDEYGQPFLDAQGNRDYAAEAKRGEMVINGFSTNSFEVAAGCSPEVVFRGKGGYVLSYLEVDGQVINDFDPNLYNWIFNEIGSDHEIKVGFKRLFTVPWPETAPNERVYDGEACQPIVTRGPSFVDGYNYHWETVYSMNPTGEYTTAIGQTNVVYDAAGNITTTNVYIRMKLYQPGYEDGVVIDYWTGTNWVKVLPRPITVQFDDYVQTSTTRKTTDFDYHIVAGTLVEGDTLDDNSGQCTNYPSKGNKTTDSITSLGDMNVTTPGVDTCNYVITVLPGDYIYPNLQLVVNAPNIVKYYDGKATNTTAYQVYPTVTTNTYGAWIVFRSTTTTTPSAANTAAARNYRRYQYVTNVVSATIRYGTSANSLSTTKPSFTNVGTNTVYYGADSVTYTVRLMRQLATGSGNRYSWGSSTDVSTQSSINGLSRPQNITYSASGTKSATVTILPRPVTVTALDAAKKYDGNPLTQPESTISPMTATTGFVENEGFATGYPRMTANSTITLPGRMTNCIDQTSLQSQLKNNTSVGNYTFKFIDGLLVVSNNQLRVSVQPREKIYDGSPLEDLHFVITDEDGNPIPESACNFTYGTALSGLPITERPTGFTDVDYRTIPYTVTAEGYGNAVSGITYMKVMPRTVTLMALDAEKNYDGTPLTYSEFDVVNTGKADEDFISGEGVTTVTMTGDSTITNAGEQPNVINAADIDEWQFPANTKRQNYTFVVQPGKLKINPWARRSLMIVDHEPLTTDWVYLAFRPNLQAEKSVAQWVRDLADRNLLSVKYGLTRAQCDACTPLVTELSDIHELREDKVWIRVNLVSLRAAIGGASEDFDPTLGYWRIHILPEVAPSGEVKSQAMGALSTEPPTLNDLIDYDEGANSLNVFGILKIESTTTNTMVAIPWTWYSELEQNAENIPVKKLVKATNLTPGDMVYISINGGTTYMAWILVGENWIPASTVTVDELGVGRIAVVADNDDDDGDDYTHSKRIARGYGMWVHRQNPVDANGKAIPFWIYGQSTHTPITTVITAPTSSGEVVSTMLGNPYAQSMKVKDIKFVGSINSKDAIWFYSPNGEITRLSSVVHPVTKKRYWRCAKSVYNAESGKVDTVYTDDVEIPAGTAFWYDRRGSGDLRIDWMPPAEVAK